MNAMELSYMSIAKTIEELSTEDKEEIRSTYSNYLKAEEEASPELFSTSGMKDSLPFIDRSPEEQQRIIAEYDAWGWEEEELLKYCIYHPTFSDPSFRGLFIDNEIPLTNRRAKSLYKYERNKFFEDAKKHSAYCIDFMEYAGLVNSRESRGRRALTGWLFAMSVMSEQQLGRNTSHELRVQTEETQFAVSITDALHTKALEMRKLAEEMLALDAAYSAVLLGRRRFGIEYMNEDGDFLHWNFFRHKSDTEENRTYCENLEIEEARIRKEQKAPD